MSLEASKVDNARANVEQRAEDLKRAEGLASRAPKQEQARAQLLVAASRRRHENAKADLVYMTAAASTYTKARTSHEAAQANLARAAQKAHASAPDRKTRLALRDDLDDAQYAVYFHKDAFDAAELALNPPPHEEDAAAANAKAVMSTGQYSSELDWAFGYRLEQDALDAAEPEDRARLALDFAHARAAAEQRFENEAMRRELAEFRRKSLKKAG